MRRRRFLAAIGAIAAPGCLETGRAENFPVFKQEVQETPLEIRRVSTDARRWILEYFPASADDRYDEEVRTIADVYADTVPVQTDRGMHRFIKCLLLNEDRDRTGEYEIQAEWARAYASGSVSREGYHEQALAVARR